MARVSQADRVLRHFYERGSLSGAEALTEYGIANLSSRISEMIAAGLPIKKEKVFSTNRYGEKVHYLRYSLEKEA